jgi:hypothetical protein
MTDDYIKELARKAYYNEYLRYCKYEDHTKPVSFEEWDKHCDEKGRWVK